MFIPPFCDRQDAGAQLAQVVLQDLDTLGWLPAHPSREVVVYGLPRGGVILALPLAEALHCPLDVVIAKKITLPNNAELAIGAVTADGQVLRARRQLFGLKTEDWKTARAAAWQRALEQGQQFDAVTPHISPTGRVAVLVDDGIATGMTMVAAARSLWSKRPAKLLICAPVAPPQVVQRLQQWCDRTILLYTPVEFYSVSRFYQNFPQVEMEEAIACLQTYNRPMGGIDH